MRDLSDRRLLTYCLIAAIVGFTAWIAFLEPASGTWILVIAIVALAALSFLDGLVFATDR